VRAYLELLRHPGVKRVLLAALVTRLTTSMLALTLLLATRDATGSYATAGLALAGHAIALAIAGPIYGRLADRARPRRVLLACLGAHLLAYAGLIAALRAAGGETPQLIVIAAIAVGATVPPSSALTRALWPRLVPAKLLPTAYALDTVSNEATFISGPLLVTAGLLVAPALPLIGAAALATLAGVAVLSSSRTLDHTADNAPHSSTGPRISPPARHPLGPLADGQVVLLLVIAALGAFSYGAAMIGAAATAEHLGRADLTGLLTSALAAGGVLGTATYGALRWNGNRRTLLVLLYLTGAAGLVLAAGTPNLVLLAVTFAALGLVEGPRDALEQLMVGDASQERYRTETFAWLNTFMWSGYGLGTSITGGLTGENGGLLALGTGAAACVLAAAAATRIQPQRDRVAASSAR
jgi:MFS family permease